METNTTILTREALALAERTKLGSIEALNVSADNRNIDFYIVADAEAGILRALPFDKSIAVGDTFLTFQSLDDLVAEEDEQSAYLTEEGYRLLGVEVYSVTGNLLGTVESFDFDPVYGDVTEIRLDSEMAFTSDTFTFFAPEFVFVDDGDTTAVELRRSKAADRGTDETLEDAESEAEDEVVEVPEAPAPKAKPAQATKAAQKSAQKPVRKATAKQQKPAASQKPIAQKQPVQEEVPTPAPRQEAPVADAAPEDDKDAEIKAVLVGSMISDDVTSRDGLFQVASGTVLTRELVDEAQQHDALLLLTLAIDD